MDRTAHRRYSIQQGTDGRWNVSKDGFHIASYDDVEDAKTGIDELLDEPEENPGADDETYETHLVFQIFSNDETLYDMMNDWAEEAVEEAQEEQGGSFSVKETATIAVGDKLQEWVEGHNPLESLGGADDLYGSLLASALAEVDWRDVAETWVEEYL